MWEQAFPSSCLVWATVWRYSISNLIMIYLCIKTAHIKVKARDFSTKKMLFAHIITEPPPQDVFPCNQESIFFVFQHLHIKSLLLAKSGVTAEHVFSFGFPCIQQRAKQTNGFIDKHKKYSSFQNPNLWSMVFDLTGWGECFLGMWSFLGDTPSERNVCDLDRNQEMVLNFSRKTCFSVRGHFSEYSNPVWWTLEQIYWTVETQN